jgi:PAS domain S-box-containing protein
MRQDSSLCEPQSQTLLGYTQSESLADADLWRKILHPDDQERVLAEVTRFYETGEPFVSDYRSVARNGRVLWFHDEAVIYEDKINRRRFIQGVMIDITERKRIETALQESEKRYRDLVEFSPVAMTVHMEGRIVYINPAGVKLWGANKADEVLGRSPLDFVHPDYHERIAERIRQICHGTIAAAHLGQNTRLDGQILYTVGTGIPITWVSRRF